MKQKHVFVFSAAFLLLAYIVGTLSQAWEILSDGRSFAEMMLPLAQAFAEPLRLVTADRTLVAYGGAVEVI